MHFLMHENELKSVAVYREIHINTVGSVFGGTPQN